VSQAGDLIRAARERSGISQRELARRAGTSQAAISRIESGREEPTVERLERVLASLGWRAEVTLVPIAQHDADRADLLEQAALDPSTRLERGLDAIERQRSKIRRHPRRKQLKSG
jgi:transcriptional regulator with XRE-family HTH domain